VKVDRIIKFGLENSHIPRKRFARAGNSFGNGKIGR
jgi:hypothetical protein